MHKRQSSFVAALLASSIGLTSCGVGHLRNVSLRPDGESASPPVLSEFEGDAEARTSDDWETRRAPLLRAAFAREFYGRTPDEFETIVDKTQILDDELYDGLGVLEYNRLIIRTRFGMGEWHEQPIRLVIAKPKSAIRPSPTVLKMDFCPLGQVFQSEALPDEGWVCGPSGFEPLNGFVWWTLGSYHIAPPIKELLSRGYAYASISVNDFVPDSRRHARERLETLSVGIDQQEAWGSLAAWAFQFSRAIDHLDTDSDLDTQRTAIYGHSRYGKSALIAGAFDSRIDAVIAHQSGRGGAALTRSDNGEPMEDMTETFSTWLSPKYNDLVASGGGKDLPFDQHQLISLIAPRAVLLGHGRRDSWSDPHGAFRAAQGATPAYRLYGSEGLTAKKLNEFDPDADISFWMRGGTHGETKKDWSAFFEFLDAHFDTDAP